MSGQYKNPQVTNRDGWITPALSVKLDSVRLVATHGVPVIGEVGTMMAAPMPARGASETARDASAQFPKADTSQSNGPQAANAQDFFEWRRFGGSTSR